MATSEVERFGVWLLPFPFTDQLASKRRPAIVISTANSFNTLTGHSVMAMVTSAYHRPWSLDMTIQDLDEAGLPSPSLIRMKLFTLDHRLFLRQLGQLSSADQKTLEAQLDKLLGREDTLN